MVVTDESLAAHWSHMLVPWNAPHDAFPVQTQAENVRLGTSKPGSEMSRGSAELLER